MWEIKGRERRERETRRGQREERERREEDRGRRVRESMGQEGKRVLCVNCKARSEEGWEATKGAFYYSQC